MEARQPAGEPRPGTAGEDRKVRSAPHARSKSRHERTATDPHPDTRKLRPCGMQRRARPAPGRPQSPKRIPRSRAASIVSQSSGTTFMRLIAALSGS